VSRQSNLPPQAAAAPVVAPLFPLGRLLMTPGVRNSLLATNVEAVLARHVQGDWGDMSADDKCANDEALAAGDLRIFSSYKFGDEKLWVITEADRSSTTILLPEEY
jgi:hypothetical protein